MHLAIALALLSAADDFDRLDGPALAGVPKADYAVARKTISEADLGHLPNVLAGTRSPLLVVKTEEGNYARLLVSPALRKAPGGTGEPTPILVVERLDTFESGPATRRIARARDLILFPGFRLDLDSGQVVPEGQGGDLQFVGKGENGPSLAASDKAAMFTLTKSPLPAKDASRPSPGRSVAPGDFSGVYRLFANGQTTGRLEILAGDAGEVSGRLRSDQTGGSYKITGDVGREAPNRIRFTAELPRTRQEFDGLIFLEGKGAIAGSYAMLGRNFGFFAVREGGTVAPDGEDLGQKPLDADPPGTLVVDLTARGIAISAKAIDEGGFEAALRAEPHTRLSVRVAEDVPAARLLRLLDLIRDAGVTSIRLVATKGP